MGLCLNTILMYKRKLVNMDKQKLAAIIITVFMGVFVAVSVHGDEDIDQIGNDINDVNSSIDMQESIKKQMDDELARLEEYKDDLVTYMNQLNHTYDKVQDEIIELDKRIAEKNSQIEQINKTLDEHNIELNEQYISMKLRIQYLYESGELNYVNAILTSGSISEILNKVEYISSIVEYDREMMDKYQEAIATVEIIKAELIEEQLELELLREEQNIKAEELIKLMNEASVNIANKSEQISEAESEALKKEQEIQSMYDYLQYLEEMESSIIAESIRESISESIRQSEEASRQSELDSSRLAAGETLPEEEETTTRQTVSDYEVQEGDVEKLAALIHCEAGGESYEGKLAVGTVVMNRVGNKIFPSTLDGVLTQPYQFSPVSVSGRYYIVLANKTYNADSLKAAEEILNDGVRTGKWHFFRTVQSAINTGKIEAHPEGIIIGNHFFY